MTKEAAVLKGYLTFAGAAKLVGRTAGVVTRAVQAGTLPYIVTECGKARLVKRADVLKWASRTNWENRRLNAPTRRKREK